MRGEEYNQPDELVREANGEEERRRATEGIQLTYSSLFFPNVCLTRVIVSLFLSFLFFFLE